MNEGLNRTDHAAATNITDTTIVKDPKSLRIASERELCKESTANTDLRIFLGLPYPEDKTNAQLV
jgi:hypothetical protein